jgi:hypothetical protein
VLHQTFHNINASVVDGNGIRVNNSPLALLYTTYKAACYHVLCMHQSTSAAHLLEGFHDVR